MNKNNAKVSPSQLEPCFTNPKQHGASSAQVSVDAKTLQAPAPWPMPPLLPEMDLLHGQEMHLPPLTVPTAPV